MTDQPRDLAQPTEHTCRTTGYTVEVMHISDRPESIGGQMVDGVWRTLRHVPAPEGLGIPRTSDYQAGIFASLGVFSFEAAQALRWCFHAEAARTHREIGLRTRLVKHSVEYQMRSTPTGPCHQHPPESQEPKP